VEATQTVRDDGCAREVRESREQRFRRRGDDPNRGACAWIASLSAVVSAQSSG
jgi:hypothetical protein